MNEVTVADVKTLLLDIVTRPTQRRLKYMCLGIGEDDTYFFCDQDEDDFKFCAVTQVVSIYQFKNQKYKDTWKYIFSKLALDRNTPGFLYIIELATVLNKIKFDLDKLEIKLSLDGTITTSYFDEKKQKESNYVLYKPCLYYFFYQYLVSTFDHYKQILIDKTTPSYDIEVAEELTEPTKFIVPSKDLLALNIINEACEDFRIFVLPLLDFIKFKKLVTPTVIGKAAIKIWGCAKLSVGMIGYFENQDVLISMMRNNITIFPQRRAVSP